MRRANLGCGIIRPDSWDNYDIDEWDVRDPFPMHLGVYDYAVANHLLGALDYDELPVALVNIRDVLKPGGVLRVIVSDITGGFHAYNRNDMDWFPYDHRMDDIDVRFCTWLTWFGTHRSVFTVNYLESLLDEAGYSDTFIVSYKVSHSALAGICDLDDRETESMFVEAIA